MSTAECLTFEARPETPHNIRKYRKTFFSEPGQRVIPTGQIDDNLAAKLQEKGNRFGRSSGFSSDHVPDIFVGIESDSIAEYVNDRKEAIYRSNQREPLGKSFIRGHAIPGHIDAFGKPQNSVNTEAGAKELLYPRGAAAGAAAGGRSDDEVKRMYIKSHNSYAPGEQRTRDYQWGRANVDPAQFRFGVVEAGTGEGGVAECIQPESQEGQTRITSVQVEKCRHFRADTLGRAKMLGTKPKGLTDDHVYGKNKPKKGAQLEAETAKDALQGGYSWDEQQPDIDLGRSIQPGWRNDTTSTRTFGCPSVRTDVKPPRLRSIGDNQNYGDEQSGSVLIYPSTYSAQGVTDEDFVQQRSRAYVEQVFADIGYKLEGAVFDKLSSRAEAAGGRLCVASFRAALNEYLDAKEIGQTPQWW